jgi:hypothetical protein
MEQVVDLSDQLHVSIFNAVMYHLDIMTRAALANPGDARRAIFGLRFNGFQQGSKMLPGTLVPTARRSLRLRRPFR